MKKLSDWQPQPPQHCSITSGAAMAEKVTLQLKWVTQAQFAGYIVAQAKGFYKEAGLEVEIKPGGPGHQPAAGSRRWRR